MNKNYYDILQVNRNASPEIIEKAYKTLAKKYHPDLQAEENKKQAEEILKEINEAYEVLSNPEKKKVYDISLSSSEPRQESTQETRQETRQEPNQSPKRETTNPSSNTTQISEEELLYKQQQELLRKQQLQQQLQYQEQLRHEQEIAYQQQLQQALKNRGYKIRYKKTMKDYIRGFITFVIVILILFLLWQIPFIQNFFVDLYKSNPILQTIVNLLL